MCFGVFQQPVTICPYPQLLHPTNTPTRHERCIPVWISLDCSNNPAAGDLRFYFRADYDLSSICNFQGDFHVIHKGIFPLIECGVIINNAHKVSMKDLITVIMSYVK